MTRSTSAARGGVDGRRLRLPAEPAHLARIRHFVHHEAVELGVDPELVADMVQAVDESATNIIGHGYGRGAVEAELELEVAVEHDALVVRIRDHAPPFDPTRLPRPDLSGPLASRPLGGMGVQLTRDLTDEVRYGTPTGWSNELTLVKRLRPEQRQER